MAKKPMKSASADARTAAPPAPARIPDHWPKRSQAVLPIDRIQPSPRNPRKTFAGLQELGESIRVQGLINPLVVRPLGDRADWKDSQWINVEAWELIAGERRFRACCLIGYPEVPVIAMPKTDAEVMELMLVENDQRSDVRPSEQAAAYSQLAAEIGAEAVAVRTGKPISQVRDLIRMARLPQWMLAAVDDGTISRSTAAVVARVPGELVRERAAAESLGLWFRDDEPVPTGAKLEKLVKAHRADDMGRDVWTHRDAKRDRKSVV